MRRRRRQLGLKQADLATEAGISLRTLKTWEAGNLPIYIQSAARLAAALDLSLDELVGSVAPPGPPAALAPLAVELAELARIQANSAAALAELATRAGRLAGERDSATETG